MAARANWLTAMTGIDPEASRLLDRTGVCCAGRGTPSHREMVTGRAFDRQIGSTKRGDRYADCRIRTGFAFARHTCSATGDRKWSSGESRFFRTESSILARWAGTAVRRERSPGAGRSPAPRPRSTPSRQTDRLHSVARNDRARDRLDNRRAKLHNFAQGSETASTLHS